MGKKPFVIDKAHQVIVVDTYDGEYFRICKNQGEVDGAVADYVDLYSRDALNLEFYELGKRLSAEVETKLSYTMQEAVTN